MKKLMLVLGLMGIVVFSFAGEKNTGKIKDVNEAQLVISEVKDSDNTEVPKICTVTQSATVSIYFVNYTVSCSATESTCEAAITSSLNCVKTALNKLKEAVQQ